MEDKKQLTKLVAAMVMGDGYLGWRSAKKDTRKVERPQYNRESNSWYGSAHVTKNRDYVEWQCDVLSSITSVSVREYGARVSSNGYVDSPKIVYETKRHPFFTTLRERTYVNGTKTVSPHDLKLFDAESLAILFMDDGWKEEGGRVGIATHNFSWADNKLLRDCLAEKLNIHMDVKVHKQARGNICYYLRSNNENGKRLIDVIASTGLITPSFEYKLLKPSERRAPETGDEIVSSLSNDKTEDAGNTAS